jgi:hypothetical protein
MDFECRKDTNFPPDILSVAQFVSPWGELSEKHQYLLRSKYEPERHLRDTQARRSVFGLFVALVWFYRQRSHGHNGKRRCQNFTDKSPVRFTVKSLRCMHDPLTRRQTRSLSTSLAYRRKSEQLTMFPQ